MFGVQERATHLYNLLRSYARWLIGLWFGVCLCFLIPLVSVVLFVVLDGIVIKLSGSQFTRETTVIDLIAVSPAFITVSMYFGIFGMLIIFSILRIRSFGVRLVKKHSPPFAINPIPDASIDSPWLRTTALNRLKLNILRGSIIAISLLIIIYFYEETLGLRIPSYDLSNYGDIPVFFFPIIAVLRAITPQSGLFSDTVLLLAFAAPSPWFGVAFRNLMYWGKLHFYDELDLRSKDPDRFKAFLAIFAFISFITVASLQFVLEIAGVL